MKKPALLVKAPMQIKPGDWVRLGRRVVEAESEPFQVYGAWFFKASDGGKYNLLGVDEIRTRPTED